MPLDENKATLFNKRALMPFRNSRFEKHYGVSTAVSSELFSNFFYSFDYGLFHFIGLDTESEYDIALITKYVTLPNLETPDRELTRYSLQQATRVVD
jgi:hypothetical protein